MDKANPQCIALVPYFNKAIQCSFNSIKDNTTCQVIIKTQKYIKWKLYIYIIIEIYLALFICLNIIIINLCLKCKLTQTFSINKLM